MKKIIIFGNGQSGSTLLTLLIGANESILNCGELFVLVNYFQNHPDKVCMDDIQLSKHPLWKIVYGELLKNSIKIDSFWRKKNKNHLSFNKNCELLFNSIENNIKEDQIVLSLKQQFRLRYMLRNEKLNQSIKPIFLIRDPRAYVNSFCKRYKAKNKFKNKSLIYTIINRTISWNFNCLKAFILIYSSNNKFFKVKYEDLTTNPKNTLTNIMGFCGSNFEINQLNYFDTRQPMFSGNKSLMDKRDPIIFRNDFVKMNNFRWFLITLISFPILIYFKYPIFKKPYKNF